MASRSNTNPIPGISSSLVSTGQVTRKSVGLEKVFSGMHKASDPLAFKTRGGKPLSTNKKQVRALSAFRPFGLCAAGRLSLGWEGLHARRMRNPRGVEGVHLPYPRASEAGGGEPLGRG